MDTTATAEWWMVAALSGALTIFGGIVGGLISFLSSYYSDQRKAARDDVLDARKYQRDLTSRWDVDVRKLSAELLMVAATAVEVSTASVAPVTLRPREYAAARERQPMELLSSLLPREGLEWYQRAPVIDNFARIIEDLKKPVTELSLLAPGQLAKAAENLSKATLDLAMYYTKAFVENEVHSDEDSETKQRRYRELRAGASTIHDVYGTRVDEFTATVHSTLKIESTDVVEMLQRAVQRNRERYKKKKRK